MNSKIAKGVPGVAFKVKCWGQILSLALSLSVLFIAINAAAASTKAGPNKVRIVISDFDMTSGNKRSETLERGFAELLTVAFFMYRQIEVVPRGELWQALINKVKPPRSEYQGKPKRVFYRDVLEHIRYDFVLSGRFSEQGENVFIQISLENAKTKKRERVGSFMIPLHRILEQIDSVALAVVNILSERQVITYKPRRIKVACFVDQSQHELSAIVSFQEDLASFLSFDLASHQKQKLLTWSWSDEICVSATQDISWKFFSDEDAVIGGTIAVQNDQILVRPTIYVRDASVAIELPPLLGSLKHYLNLKLALSQKISQFIGAIVSQEGSWQMDDIIETDKTPTAYLARAKLLIDGERVKPELVVYFLEWAIHLAKSPGSPDSDRDLLAELNYLLGNVRFQQRQDDEAEEQYREALDADPYFLEAHMALGDVHLERKKYKQAIESYEKAKKARPGSFQAYDRIATVYIIQEKYELATEQYESYLQRYPDKARPLERLAFLMMKKEDFEKAASFYKKALAKASKDERAEFEIALAKMYYETGEQRWRENKLELAFEAFKESLLWAKKTETFQALAIVQLKLKKYEDSIRSITKAIELKPNNPDHYLIRAFIKRKYLSRYNDAIVDYNRCVSISPKWGEPYIGRGLAYMMVGNDDQAVEDFRKAGILYTNNYNIAGALENVGLVLLGQKKWQEAYDNAEEVNQIYNRLPWNWLIRYVAASELGKDYEATKSQQNWKHLRSPDDVKGLRHLLPKSLQKYIE
jgi:tetratricopeptide (TPR) repeat protein/TolB-like protein